MTSSGINMDWWTHLLRRTAIVVGATRGPVFCDEDGYVWDSVTINEMLHEALESIYTMKKDRFPNSGGCKTQVWNLPIISTRFRFQSSEPKCKYFGHTCGKSMVKERESKRRQDPGTNGTALCRPESL